MAELSGRPSNRGINLARILIHVGVRGGDVASGTESLVAVPLGLRVAKPPSCQPKSSVTRHTCDSTTVICCLASRTNPRKPNSIHSSISIHLYIYIVYTVLFIKIEIAKSMLFEHIHTKVLKRLSKIEDF